MTPHLEQRLAQIAAENDYSWPAGEIAHAMRLAYQAATTWYSPDVLPKIKRGGSGFFYVAVKRSNGKTHTFPAVYLNEMSLVSEGITSEGLSGNRWTVEAGNDADYASGWFDFKTHADYDDCYQALLGETDELVAWAEAPVFDGRVEHWSVQPKEHPNDRD